MDKLSRIANYKNKQKYVRLTRCRGKFEGFARGYIIDYSSTFVLLQTADDFGLNGYEIFPVDTITEVRHNKYDIFYDKIMKQEKWKEQIGIPFNIDLSTWKALFQTLKKTRLTVTIECEDPELDYFCIGSLNSIGEKKVSSFYFTPDGIIDEKPTFTEYKHITRVNFDNQYANILTKYLKTKN